MLPFGISVVNLLPDPDTGWMWISIESMDPDSRRKWCTKKDYYYFLKLDVSLERLRFFLKNIHHFSQRSDHYYLLNLF